MTIDEKKLDSQLENNEEQVSTTIIATLPWSEVQKFESNAISTIGAEMKVDGFRPGKIPANVVRQRVSQAFIDDRMAREAISESYHTLVHRHELRGIGRPEVEITKLTPGENIEFSITVANFPAVELPDYKKIAEKINKEPIDTEVTDKEMEDGINNLREQWARSEKYQEALRTAQTDEEKQNIDPSSLHIEEAEWPELDDEFAKKIGGFESLHSFKDSFKKNLGTHKGERETEKRQAEIIEAIQEQSVFKVPHLVYESELERMIAQMKAEVEQAGLQWGQYLEHAKKTEDELRKEWMPQAIKRANTQLLLNKIAAEEDLKPDHERVHAEVEALKKRAPQADVFALESHVYTILSNQKVVEFLSTSTTPGTKEKSIEQKKSK